MRWRSGPLLDALRRHEADAAVFLAQPDARRFTDLDVNRVSSLAVGAVVPEGHPLAARTTFAIEDIGNEPLILYARDVGDLYDVIMKQCRERDFAPARIEEVDRVETILGLVAAGEGISIVPRVYESLGFRGVVYRTLTPAPEPLTMLVARGSDAHSPLATAFIETCRHAAS